MTKILVAVFTCSALAAQPLVRSVNVAGTALEVKLSTQVGRPLDSRTVEQDLRYLWSLGRFDDIRVEAAEEAGDGISVVFRTAPRQVFRIRRVIVEPDTFGLNSTLPEGALLDRMGVHRVAIDAQKQLAERGFPNARASYELTPAARGSVDLKLSVDRGEALRAGGVEFTGDRGLPDRELEGALRALQPKWILPGWRILPSYTDAAVDADAARLQSYYFFQGYFDADVRAAKIASAGKQAHVTIEIQAGPPYSKPPLDFCPRLFAERRAAEREGALDFSVTANIDAEGQLTTSTTRGEPYRVGRIEFSGNRSFSDAFVRRNLVIDEGEPFEQRKLRQSLARLNMAGVFESIDERSVAIVRRPERVADIHIRLTERKRGSWRISGPVGPASFAGPLQGSIGMRLFSTYTLSLSALAVAPPLLPILAGRTGKLWFPVASLQRPYTPGEGWRSGFAIAPQLGWPVMTAVYLTTQLERRLAPLLSGRRGLEPELPFTVHRESSDTTAVCEPPGPRFGLLRRVTGIALHTLAGASGF